MKKILITGGSGYLGSVVAKYCLYYGYDVTVLDNFMFNQTSLLYVCHDELFHVVRADVTNHDVMLDHLRKNKYDYIIPMACLTGAPMCNENPERAEAVIVTAIKNMLWSLDKDIRIIYPTTNSGYGVGGDGFCTEETPLNPISYYGRFKCEAEETILARGNSISFRLATAFGVSPRMRTDLLVNDLVYRALTDKSIVVFEGHFRRNFVHVRDVATAFIHAIENWDKMKDNIYNLGMTSANLTKLELANKIASTVPSCVIIESDIGIDPDKRDYIVSNAKLEATGWKPKHDIDFGITELKKCYQFLRKNQYSNV